MVNGGYTVPILLQELIKMRVMNLIYWLHSLPEQKTNLNCVNKKMAHYETVLQSLDFVVKRDSGITGYYPTLNLTAIRNNIVIRITRDAVGSQDISLALRHGENEYALSLFINSFNELLSMINQTFVVTPKSTKPEYHPTTIYRSVS